MKPLYALAAELSFLLDETPDGEIPPDLAARIDFAELAFEAKVESVCFAYQQRKAEAAAYRAERERLEKLEASAIASVDWLKGYLQRTLLGLGLSKVKTPYFSVRVQVNPQPKITLDCPAEELPPAYKTTTVRTDANREALLEAWRDGRTLPAGVRVEQGSHLRIG